MKVVLHTTGIHKWVKALALAVLALPLAGYSDAITQAVVSANSGTAIDTAIWGTPAAAPASANDYVVGNLDSSNNSRLGSLLTGRVRAYTTPYVFPGDSLTIPASAELLIKDKTMDLTANIILDGGVLRSAVGGGAGHEYVTGTVTVATSGYIGTVESSGNIFTINSAVVGSSSAVLHIASGANANQTVEIAGDLSAFEGTLAVGGGDAGVIMNVLSSGTNASILTGIGAGTINIGTNVTFKSLDWINLGETNSVAVGSYNSDQLNDLLGTTQFTSIDTNYTLTVTTNNYPVYVPPVGIPAEIYQVVYNLGWNDLTSWSYNTAMVSTSAYFTVDLSQSVTTKINHDVGSSLRSLNAADPFLGDSLTIADNTELLIKNEGGIPATCTNLILAGGVIRYSPNGNPVGILEGGTLTVTTNSYIGIVQTAATTFTIDSDLQGSGDLSLRGGQASGGIPLVLAFAGDLSAYTGDFILGEGQSDLTLDFDQDYDLPNLDIIINTPDTNITDTVQLDQTVKVRSFSRDGVYLPAGSAYTAPQLDSFFGVTNFVDAGGTLEVYENLGVPTTVPVITSIIVNGTDVTLSWTAEDLGTYAIESKTSLSDLSWSTVVSNLPSGNLTTNFTSAGADSEFFRVTGE